MDNSRRNFFKRGLSAVAAVSVAQLAANRIAFAADLPHVDEAGPQAAALGYKHDGATVDKAKYPRYADAMACHNCALYQGAAGSEWGGCGLFAGQAVAAKGWCNAYAPKA
ncbi:MAG: high-potential iron-sulfur protein [Gammaproteobacteria bacterium]|nr:high-potential iron-sulfur protein [Gammaproteobacteria bacterium]